MSFVDRALGCDGRGNYLCGLDLDGCDLLVFGLHLDVPRQLHCEVRCDEEAQGWHHRDCCGRERGEWARRKELASDGGDHRHSGASPEEGPGVATWPAQLENAASGNDHEPVDVEWPHVGGVLAVAGTQREVDELGVREKERECGDADGEVCVGAVDAFHW